MKVMVVAARRAYARRVTSTKCVPGASISSLCRRIHSRGIDQLLLHLGEDWGRQRYQILCDIAAAFGEIKTKEE